MNTKERRSWRSIRMVLEVSALAIGLAASCQAPQPAAEEEGAQQSAAAQPAGGEIAAAAGPEADPVERGRYLVTVLACNDCHTPFKMGPNGPEPDMSRMLSGHPQDLLMPDPPQLPEGPWGWVGAATNTAFAGPWGVSYATNITPDENTGVGIWTEEIFLSTMKSGKHWGASRPILPPMPWPSYSQLTDKDLKAVFAYLRSIPAMVNRVPEAVVAPPPAAA